MYSKKNKKNSTFIIAELSANHNNNFDLAVKTIEAMAKVGADAVKIQTYEQKVCGKVTHPGDFIQKHQCHMNGNQN